MKEKQNNKKTFINCIHSPDKHHHFQDSKKNTIPACIYCGKLK